jgi:hypothetical protein
MATLAVQDTLLAGLAPTYASAALTDEFINPTDESCFVHYKNTNAATRTVTVTKQRSTVSVPGYGAVATADQVVTLAANTGDHMLGPFPAALWNDANGKVQLAVSAIAGVTVAVIRVKRTVG